jgi:hypothetical protein
MKKKKRYHSKRGGARGEIVLRTVCHGFDMDLELMSTHSRNGVIDTPPPPLLPQTRASPAGDVYMGPPSFLRWSDDGTAIEQHTEAGHGWFPRQLVGGMAYSCVATFFTSPGVSMPPDCLGVATVTADDALRWSDAIAAHTSSMRLRILHGDGMLPRVDGSSVILYPGVDTMVHFWQGDA